METFSLAHFTVEVHLNIKIHLMEKMQDKSITASLADVHGMGHINSYDKIKIPENSVDYSIIKKILFH